MLKRSDILGVDPRTPLFLRRTPLSIPVHPLLILVHPSPHGYVRGTARYIFGGHRALTKVLPAFSYELQGPCLQWEEEG